MRLQRQTAWILLAYLLLTATACSSKKVNVEFETTEPLRVMVLPFVQLDSDGTIIQPDAGLFIDGVPLISAELAENPPELLRQQVQAELGSTMLDVLSPYLVNVELPHHGYARDDGSFDMDRIYAADAKELCKDFLDCDAVLYGYVTTWDRSYYGLQTVNSIGLKLKLVSARSGKVLYEVEVGESTGRGLSGGPTGFSDLVIEPIRGLDSDQIQMVSRKVVNKAVEPLRVESRPEFLSAPAPSIYAVSHSPMEIQSAMLAQHNRLLVLVFGSPGNKGYFSIGETVLDFPMVEVEPGQYVGEFAPLPREMFVPQPVHAALVDTVGRRTEQVSAGGSFRVK